MATDVEKLIQEIRSLSPDDQRRLREALADEHSTETATSPPPDETAELKYQRRLVKAGLLSEIKRPRRDAEAFKNRKLAEIKGKPLSETIIEERR